MRRGLVLVEDRRCCWGAYDDMEKLGFNGDVSYCDGDVSHCDGDVSHCDGDVSHCDGDVSRCDEDVSQTYLGCYGDITNYKHVVSI